jgi:phage tail-like protein
MKSRQIAHLLPAVIRRTLGSSPPLAALLGVMEAMHAPSEAALRAFRDVIDPYAAPERFVPYLASWVGLEPVLDERGEISSGTSRLRELVAASHRLAKWRGTARGLVLFLEIATGLRGFAIDEPRPFHFTLTLPPGATAHRSLIERIVMSEKPAYVTAEILETI